MSSASPFFSVFKMVQSFWTEADTVHSMSVFLETIAHLQDIVLSSNVVYFGL